MVSKFAKRTALVAGALVALAAPAAHAQVPYGVGAGVQGESVTAAPVAAAGAAPAQGEALPRTGDDSMELGKVGFALVVTGGALSVFAMRRRQLQTAQA